MWIVEVAHLFACAEGGLIVVPFESLLAKFNFRGFAVGF
jgi:hypothetical protein